MTLCAVFVEQWLNVLVEIYRLRQTGPGSSHGQGKREAGLGRQFQWKGLGLPKNGGFSGVNKKLSTRPSRRQNFGVLENAISHGNF